MSTKYKDYYELLGVERDASESEIQRAFRERARKYHPDVNKEPGTEQRFREINEAYEVLKDPDKRKRYDALGEDWKAGQEFKPPDGWEEVFSGFGGGKGSRVRVETDFGGMDGAGFSDFFESLFGARDVGAGFSSRPRARARPRPAQGRTQEAELTISLAEAFHAGRKSFTLTRTDAAGNRSSKTYDVKIPVGVTTGTTIRLPGQGEPGRSGGGAGDLLLKVHIARDDRFEVHGHNLHTKLRISPSEAALGAKVPVETLIGSVSVTVPAGSQSGQRLRIRGQGLPRADGEPGELLAEIQIVVPKELTDTERALYQRLGEVSNFDPRKT